MCFDARAHCNLGASAQLTGASRKQLLAASYLSKEMAFGTKNVEEVGEWLKSESFDSSTIEIFTGKYINITSRIQSV